MQYFSTRDRDHRVGLSEAISEGLAPDGGLYVPTRLPALEASASVAPEHIRHVGRRLLEPFFSGDQLRRELAPICRETFSFDIPLRQLDDHTSVLELFHGPSAAFKDVGAGFLSACLSRLHSDTAQRLTVLVATSGDTGSAVAAAFDRRPNVDVIVLYPAGKVSPRQEKLLTCWGPNIESLAVEGDFDDCQRLVKAAFADDELRKRRNLTSANSINIGRLLPQMVYYAAASIWHAQRHDQPAHFAIPTGNLGNAIACLYTRECGFPIDRVLLAVNENEPIVHYLETGQFTPFETVETLASAMDVGNPSNMERLRTLWPDVETTRRKIEVEQIDDDTIRRTIKEGPDRWGHIWDPHTACAVAARQRRDSPHWVVVATAHPAKFDETIEGLLQREISVPGHLEELLAQPTRSRNIDASLEALKEALAD